MNPLSFIKMRCMSELSLNKYQTNAHENHTWNYHISDFKQKESCFFPVVFRFFFMIEQYHEYFHSSIPFFTEKADPHGTRTLFGCCRLYHQAPL